MRLAALVAAAALAGCSSPPMIDGGAIAVVLTKVADIQLDEPKKGLL